MAADQPAPFLRLFLALAVPPEVREAIGRAQGRLQRHSPPGAIRWTRPDQFHVTLKFLGDVPAEQVAGLEASVAPICAACPALSMSARGIGFFPGTHQPRVIWVGARDGQRGNFTADLADASKSGVPQVSKPAVSPISKSAGPRKGAASAGLETRDTADLEVCGTGLPMKYPGQGQLSELHRQIDDALRWLAPAERPEKFTGHITLGRFKPGHHAAIPKLLELAAGLRDLHFGDWQAEAVEIVRSELTSTGAEHAVVARFRLAG